MKDAPTILENDLEIHYIQELYGNNQAILDIYELRKNFGRGRIKTPYAPRSGLRRMKKSLTVSKSRSVFNHGLKRSRNINAGRGYQLKNKGRARSEARFQLKQLKRLKIERSYTNLAHKVLKDAFVSLMQEALIRGVAGHEIHLIEAPLVQQSIAELGEFIVLRTSFDHCRAQYDHQIEQDYLNALRGLLAEAYLADNSKAHLREYVDHKFGADLGL